MARKKPHEEHENHERWLVSYADFITLLFAFFVVMYAVSSVNEGKYRVLSESLVSAFRSSTKSLQPIQIGQAVRSPAAATPHPRQSPMVMRTPTMFIPNKRHEGEGQGPGQRRREEELARIGRAVAGMLEGLVDKDIVKIHRRRDWVEVEIKDRFLFKQGGAELQSEAARLLVRLAGLLRKIGNPLRIEGHTDDQVVRSRRYPTNWDLSLARAATVVKLFEKERVSPWRMSAAGFGEYRPIASNAIPEGRARNRRVTLVILASQAVEREYDLEQAKVAERLARSSGEPRPETAPSEDGESRAAIGGDEGEVVGREAPDDPPDRSHDEAAPIRVDGHDSDPEPAVLAAAGHAEPMPVGTAAAGAVGDPVRPSRARPRRSVPAPPPASAGVIEPPIRLPAPIRLPIQ